MTEKEIYQKINLIHQQLTLINKYHHHFEERLGKEGLEEYINSRLDELSKMYKLINNE